MKFKHLLFLLLLFMGVSAKANEVVLTSASDNITGGNTATWTVDGITWTLSGGSIIWDNSNNCYTLAASTTYTLTWNKSVVVSKMVANQQINRQFGTRSPKTVLSNNDGTVTTECSNYSGFGDGTLENLTEVVALKITTSDTYATNKMTYRLKLITLTYTCYNAGEDVSSVLTNSWTPQSTSYQAFGDWNGGKELYRNNTTAFDAGDILTQTVNVPNGLYEIQFYAFENFSNWDKDANIPYGENICEAFANDAKYSLTSIKNTGGRAFDDNTLVSLICEVIDGKLKFGLRNIAVGGNWAACKAKSLIYLGDGTITVPEGVSMTTYVTSLDLDFSNTENLKAYKVTSVSNNYVHLDEVGQVPAGTPLFIIGETEKVPVIASATAVEGNLLVACSHETIVSKADNGTNYVFAYKANDIENTKGFYSIGATPATVPAGKAYLHVDGATGNSRLLIGFDEETGISSIGTENGNIADGKYLQNGKIVIVKNGVHYIINGLKK